VFAFIFISLWDRGFETHLDRYVLQLLSVLLAVPGPESLLKSFAACSNRSLLSRARFEKVMVAEKVNEVTPFI
jgi:hypothetical protein